jgi:hypothetical protein
MGQASYARIGRDCEVSGSEVAGHAVKSLPTGESALPQIAACMVCVLQALEHWLGRPAWAHRPIYRCVTRLCRPML